MSNSWSTVAFLDDQQTQSDTWHEMNIDLNNYLDSDDFNVRMTAISSNTNEIIRINDASINGVEKTTNLTIFSDDASTFDNWDLTKTPWNIVNTLDIGYIYQDVFVANNCHVLFVTECVITLKDGLNMTLYERANLTFSYKFTGIGSNEGLKIEFNDENGIWNQLAFYSVERSAQSVLWDTTTFNLDNYTSNENFKMRFTVINNHPAEYVYLNDIRIYGDLKTPYMPPIPHISSSNTNNLYAKAGDTVTVTLNVTESVSNVTAIILDRNASFFIDADTINVTQNINTNDTNGPVTFDIYLNTTSNEIKHVTQDNLTVNIIIDTIKPVITINGNNLEFWMQKCIFR